MTRTSRHSDMDMTTGPLFKNILKFIFPLIVTNLLQHCYHAADIMIVGLSPEPDAIGAVGSTASFLALIRNLFIGFSMGTSVVVARNIGSGDREKTEKSMHTSVCMSVLFGVIGAIVGILLTRPVLIGMGYSGKLLALAIRYSYIYLACMPFLSLTNFLAAIFQAKGDTRTSLYVLTATGVLNILLNFFFVMVCGLSVEGVAIATAIANLVSALVLWLYLAKGSEHSLCFKKMRIDRGAFLDIVRIGLPAGIQNSLFSISNILIQKSILRMNDLLTPVGSSYAPVIKGNAAAGSIEEFIFGALAAVTVTASAFAAQNAGAGRYRRIHRAFVQIALISVGISIVIPGLAMLFHVPLFSLYGVKDGGLLGSIAYRTAFIRMIWKWPAFFVYAIMTACAGTIRGLGKSSLAAAVTFFGTCVFRIVWIYTAFEIFENLETIYISYPISWGLTGAFFLVLLYRILKKKIRESDRARAELSDKSAPNEKEKAPIA